MPQFLFEYENAGYSNECEDNDIVAVQTQYSRLISLSIILY